MSTITIRAEANPLTDVPQRPAVLIIDGVRVNTGPHSFTMDAKSDPIELSPSVDDSDGGEWKAYKPGVRTYTIAWGDVLIMQTTDAPERNDVGNGMVEWTWRNVAIEGQL